MRHAPAQELLELLREAQPRALPSDRTHAQEADRRRHLGRDAIGEVPDEKLNLYGGSISLGHPFAATGARQALTMANELVRRDSGTALITQCAAGGLGAALILER